MDDNQEEIKSANDNQTPPNPRGGRRPGAGRPTGARSLVAHNARVGFGPKAFRELYDQEVQKAAPAVVRAAIRAAKRGDSRAIVDLLNRIMGPPSQRLEVSGPGGTPLALQAAAPVALAMMSTEELRALAGLHRRLGLSAETIDAQVAEVSPDAPVSSGPPSDSSLLSSPLLLDPTVPSRGAAGARRSDIDAPPDTTPAPAQAPLRPTQAPAPHDHDTPTPAPAAGPLPANDTHEDREPPGARPSTADAAGQTSPDVSRVRLAEPIDAPRSGAKVDESSAPSGSRASWHAASDSKQRTSQSDV